MAFFILLISSFYVIINILHKILSYSISIKKLRMFSIRFQKKQVQLVLTMHRKNIFILFIIINYNKSIIIIKT